MVDQLDDGRDHVEYENNYQLVVKKLEGFINEMPEKRKEVFIQRKQIGKPVKQIAEELGVSVKTVENQITEAMKYLKKRFERRTPWRIALLYFIP